MAVTALTAPMAHLIAMNVAVGETQTEFAD